MDNAVVSKLTDASKPIINALQIDIPEDQARLRVYVALIEAALAAGFDWEAIDTTTGTDPILDRAVLHMKQQKGVDVTPKPDIDGRVDPPEDSGTTFNV